MLRIDRKYIAALILVVAAVVAASLMPPQILRLIVDDYLMAGNAEGLLLMGLLYRRGDGLGEPDYQPFLAHRQPGYGDCGNPKRNIGD